MRQNRLPTVAATRMWVSLALPALSGTELDVSNLKTNARASKQSANSPRDLLSAGLAGAGGVLALYLLAAHSSGSLIGCPVGGGCDLVQQSRWATLWGVPIAAWGAGFYALLMGVSLWRDLRARLSILLVLTTVGLCASVYLNFVTWRELRVTCPYCLVSLTICGTLTAWAWWRCNGERRLWLGALSGMLATLGVVVMHQSFGGYAQALTGPENQYLSALAAHLKQSGARFYGASWCPHCQHQKALFGPAWEKLPYVECSPHGPGTPQATDCMTANISTYPTWVIREKPRAKMLTIQELATLSGFKPPTPAARSR